VSLRTTERFLRAAARAVRRGLRAGRRQPRDPWGALFGELDLWAAEGRTANFWWRNDDVEALTRGLVRLLDLQAGLGVPLTLSVIPGGVSPALGGLLERQSRRGAAVAVVQHGFSHLNHAPRYARPAELTARRPRREVFEELARGRRRLETLPGSLPVLVPPWNRIPAAWLPLLPELGLYGLSTFGPRPRPNPARGVTQANVHVDPLSWGGRPAFVGEGAVLGEVRAQLSARRRGAFDPHEPVGLNTHHLCGDANLWRFVEEFVERTGGHAAVRWLTAERVFRQGGQGQGGA
jgi:hypothetical protein